MNCLYTYANIHTLSMTFKVLHDWLYVTSCVPFCPSCPSLQSYYLEDSRVPSALFPWAFALTNPWTWNTLPSALNTVASFSTLSLSVLLKEAFSDQSTSLELALLFSVYFLLGLYRTCHRSSIHVERMNTGSLLEMILLPIMVSLGLNNVVQQNCTGSQRLG